MSTKINPLIKRALEETGLPWQLVWGHGHNKIRLNGKLVGVVSASRREDAYNSTRNVISQIRNAARQMR